MAEQKINKKYVIEFDDSAYDKQGQSSNFSGKIREYNGRVYKMNDYVNELDRFDDFDSLKIPLDQYENKGGEYGIRRNTEHKGYVIYDHQAKAAQAFLRDLRGFGMLADVVGSGKTFEACLVVSELAVRNKIRSLLFIVPEQVKSDWVRVVEMAFGLGKGILYQATDVLDEKKMRVETINGFKVPRTPIIVSTDDYVKWKQDYMGYLFDCIVVDEAHHLCAEEGVYAQAMKQLSQMIVLKKKAKSAYCLLLSATPHSGNLENMYRLWYFVRLQGGIPQDFDEKNDKDRTKAYNDEKDYYKNFVCRGAKTVMEFIERTKIDEVQNNYPEQFKKFLMAEKLTTYAKLPVGKKGEAVTKFLYQNDDISDEVHKSVAKAYHNRVLRSIMIRQPNANLIAKKKNVVNLLFFKTRNDIPDKVEVNDQGRNLEFNIKNLYSNDSLYYKNEDEHTSIMAYCEEFSGALKPTDKYTDFLINNIIRPIDNVDALDKEDNIFEKKNSLQYYEIQFKYSPKGVDNRIYPIKYVEGDIFTHKFEMTKKLLDKHQGQKVIVFFDYDLKRKENLVERFTTELKATSYGPRVIEGNAQNKIKVCDQFESSRDAILVVTDSSFTEGVNLQTCNIIINFQVTNDPMSMDQRIGRIFRLGQKNDVTIYSLADMDKLEGYSLMYLTRIGLLTSNSGDATIIAGSNSEQMVSIRCNRCGNVELISKADFEYRKQNDDLYCQTSECKVYETKMTEISVNDFKCDKCGVSFVRSEKEEGYLCISSPAYGNPRSILCNDGKTRKYFCRKICAMANCDKFNRANNCNAVKAFKENRNVSDADLLLICAICNDKSCNPECKPNTSISKCMTCSEAHCMPKPYIIEFDDKWEAKCPICGKDKHGYIRPMLASTFATYIRNAWNFRHDGGRSFCKNLLTQSDKVSEIKTILDMDNLEDN